MEVEELQPGRVVLTVYNEFTDTGELVIEKLTLEFREREQIERPAHRRRVRRHPRLG